MQWKSVIIKFLIKQYWLCSKGIFVEALRIIDTKFPRKTAEIEIFNVYHGYYISKMEDEAPKLTDTNDNEILVDSDENNNN